MRWRRSMKSKIILVAVLLCVLFSACGKSGKASGGRTTESAASEISSTEVASKGIYTNDTLGIRIIPGDNFEPYENADAFARAVRGKKWKTAFGENNRFEFGYVISSDSGNGYFYGYSTKLSEKEQDHDLSDFVTALELQVANGAVQENGTKDIGKFTWQELDISGDDGTQEIIYLTKSGDSIFAIVIGQMEDVPIEEMCMDAIGQ